MNNESLRQAFKNAYKYYRFCHKFGNNRKDLLNPIVKEFCIMKLSKWHCPVCDLGLEKFLNLIAILLSTTGATLDISTLEHAVKGMGEIDRCALSTEYFLDGLYRILSGENFEELMAAMHSQLQNELQVPSQNAREKYRQNIISLKKRFEQEVKKREKEFDDILIKLNEEFELKISRNTHLCSMDQISKVHSFKMELNL